MMQDQQEQGEDQPHGGYCIEIRVNGDGTFSVSSEPIEEMDGGESGQQAKSIQDVMRIVLDIYANDGTSGAGDEAFNAGFGGGNPMMEGE